VEVFKDQLFSNEYTRELIFKDLRERHRTLGESISKEKLSFINNPNVRKGTKEDWALYIESYVSEGYTGFIHKYYNFEDHGEWYTIVQGEVELPKLKSEEYVHIIVLPGTEKKPTYYVGSYIYRVERPSGPVPFFDDM